MRNHVEFICGGELVEALQLNSGGVLWNYPCNNAEPPALADGVLYVMCGTNPVNLDGFDVVNGGSPWQWPLNIGSVYSPAVAGGMLYFGDYDGNAAVSRIIALVT